jgi:ribulose-5-phosphate 4-epimerase/fuculose-1-phosphate aldolase
LEPVNNEVLTGFFYNVPGMIKRPGTIALIAAVALALAIRSGSAQPAPVVSDPDEANIADLVTASHILANEGIMDSRGHASVRSVKNPRYLFMPRAMSPGDVQRADIVELDSATCATVDHSTVQLNGERFIHCRIYRARPDVMAVIHTHDPAVLPLPISGTPLRPVIGQAGFLPDVTPVFEIRNAPGPEKGMLIRTAALGDALARALGKNPVVLMRGHGDTIVGPSVKEATVRSIYTDIDARAEMAALALSPHLIVLNAAERAAYDTEQKPDKPWEGYKERLPAQR